MQGDSQLVMSSQGEEASRSGTPRHSAQEEPGDRTSDLPVYQPTRSTSGATYRSSPAGRRRRRRCVRRCSGPAGRGWAYSRPGPPRSGARRSRPDTRRRTPRCPPPPPRRHRSRRSRIRKGERTPGDREEDSGFLFAVSPTVCSETGMLPLVLDCDNDLK